MAVTREQVQEAAKKYLAPDRLQIIAVGDAAKVSGALAKFGTVQQFDANGNRIGGVVLICFYGHNSGASA
jgi:predicted Zn-dependent peptidase